MGKVTTLEKIGYCLLAVVIILGSYLGFTDETFFNTQFAQEDGPIEWGTAILLFAISMLSLYRLTTLNTFKKWLWKLGTLVFVVLFFFAAGEEISWGQRIFGVASSDFFLENNAQGETNLHNLVVGDKKLNKIIFSQLLTVVMVIYLVITPILYRKWSWCNNMANRFAVPIVQWHHTIAFFVTTLLVALNPADRKWEVYEMAFGLLFFIIFLNPLNAETFKKKKPNTV
ncbi:hypothetical protein U1E44_02950 [Arenibacter sp. GZD96]|uniref:hypothetical protein n=1 Tax=Aurantibrevibacter litoralis TaxID=3106030 RepID=UPI002AFFC2E2|nr:hypothetical protein [Arenibacter sp. GZD-96]MEA1785039.1 hypothetical protein [Arenibacter sp. GZD-96]